MLHPSQCPADLYSVSDTAKPRWLKSSHPFVDKMNISDRNSPSLMYFLIPICWHCPLSEVGLYLVYTMFGHLFLLLSSDDWFILLFYFNISSHSWDWILLFYFNISSHSWDWTEELWMLGVQNFMVEWLVFLSRIQNSARRPAILRAFVVFLSPSRQVPAQHYKVGHARFLSQPSQCIITYSSYHLALYNQLLTVSLNKPQIK
jgi:hypothetical protein